MPTFARLVAAVLFAALAWWVSQLIVPLMPNERPMGYFAIINAAVGLVMGWRIQGARAGNGYNAAIGISLTTVAAVVFWGLLLNSTIVMVELSLRKSYDGAVEAVVGVVDLMATHGKIMLDPTVIGTLLVGGLAIGMVTEWASRRAY
ncbi:TrgA family protein [Cognatishimia sp. MH4019]|uniref:TrgA family protein n=1 Tax=Cognatishimia sp. MH4019 TaxID=2854030 RepID=UPI001CD7116F|nr:TrgA family protein [Cognatishimia sp. MH4019]